MSLRSIDNWKVKSYNDFKVHHMVVLYGTLHALQFVWNKAGLTKTIVAALSNLSEQLIPIIYSGWIPDILIRFGIRLQLRHHLDLLDQTSCVNNLQTKMKIVQDLSVMDIAIETKAANQQHYEVPAKFYDLCLGPAKKYSSGYWPTSQTTFAESEIHMLELYCQRAKVQDGMKIVDLGCGWGSLSLFLLERYPDCHITSISNSHSQREYIINTAKERNLNLQNLTVLTCNVADDQGKLNAVQNNDLVMTVEMFEHMKNYKDLLSKVSNFLKPNGKLFVHIFTHKEHCYHFEKGWMADTFFSGGTMPSDDLLLYFCHHFHVEQHWRVNGTHYEKTSNGWLNMLDDSWKNGLLKPVLAQAYGEGNEHTWYINWRLFYLACAELWGFDHGEEWIVSHYLFQRRS